MSASLVGSEMCIRDRTWAMAASVGWTACPAAMLAEGLFGCQMPELMRRCLLYTSDAADDM
eukprot:10033393-Alexandrium_andersonii.AAC.1